MINTMNCTYGKIGSMFYLRESGTRIIHGITRWQILSVFVFIIYAFGIFFFSIQKCFEIIHCILL